MTITARANLRKDASYKLDGKQFARQISRYYDISGTTMESISKQVILIKAYLDKNLSVLQTLPQLKDDPKITDWKEEEWKVDW